MEEIISGAVLIVLGGIYVARPGLCVRLQIWAQRVVMGAKYEPSPRTYKAMKIMGSGFVVLGLVIIVTAQTQKPIAVANYKCDEGKAISAKFFEDKNKSREVKPREMPVPTGRAEIKLSDGREMELRQTISASGIRYSDGNPMIEGDEKLVFWSKGETALILENNTDQTYINCVETE